MNEIRFYFDGKLLRHISYTLFVRKANTWNKHSVRKQEKVQGGAIEQSCVADKKKVLELLINMQGKLALMNFRRDV